MFVELLEKLRCPNEHEPSPLIATASRTENRRIVEGTLGCPVCHAEFEVRDGALDLGGSDVAIMITPDVLSDERMMRTAAQLGLDERGGLYVLGPVESFFIDSFTKLSAGSMFVALTGYDAVGAAGWIKGSDGRIPLAAGCVRGIATGYSDPGHLRAAVRALAPGGRLVAPASARVPAGIEVIAEDSDEWVGERVATPQVAKIGRARP